MHFGPKITKTKSLVSFIQTGSVHSCSFCSHDSRGRTGMEQVVALQAAEWVAFTGCADTWQALPQITRLQG